ncbi:hypothetical protein K469DRAFT_800335 [Zopfia rhizophila CBS 207.26]|uniref:Uncharacterized protein n=1 Tax=Zopfia rhizophila CBS 207.26 TaxID=1314779 RepID=A0A6A6ELG8_9PEZI|nr:hypothetical protein K469DRAFT_800335 [Zopfia rhizophila CBS 207.26]
MDCICIFTYFPRGPHSTFFNIVNSSSPGFSASLFLARTIHISRRMELLKILLAISLRRFTAAGEPTAPPSGLFRDSTSNSVVSTDVSTINDIPQPLITMPSHQSLPSRPTAIQIGLPTGPAGAFSLAVDLNGTTVKIPIPSSLATKFCQVVARNMTGNATLLGSRLTSYSTSYAIIQTLPGPSIPKPTSVRPLFESSGTLFHPVSPTSFQRSWIPLSSSSTSYSLLSNPFPSPSIWQPQPDNIPLTSRDSFFSMMLTWLSNNLSQPIYTVLPELPGRTQVSPSSQLQVTGVPRILNPAPIPYPKLTVMGGSPQQSVTGLPISRLPSSASMQAVPGPSSSGVVTWGLKGTKDVIIEEAKPVQENSGFHRRNSRRGIGQDEVISNPVFKFMFITPAVPAQHLDSTLGFTTNESPLDPSPSPFNEPWVSTNPLAPSSPPIISPLDPPLTHQPPLSDPTLGNWDPNCPIVSTTKVIGKNGGEAVTVTMTVSLGCWRSRTPAPTPTFTTVAEATNSKGDLIGETDTGTTQPTTTEKDKTSDAYPEYKKPIVFTAVDIAGWLIVAGFAVHGFYWFLNEMV